MESERSYDMLKFDREEATKPDGSSPREKLLEALDQQIDYAKNPDRKMASGRTPSKWWFCRAGKTYLDLRYGSRSLLAGQPFVVQGNLVEFLLKVREGVANGEMDKEVETAADAAREVFNDRMGKSKARKGRSSAKVAR